VEKILSIDRFLIDSEDSRADEYSFYTQNLSGAVALTVPLLMTLFWIATRRRSAGQTLKDLGTDWLLLLQTTLFNGLFTELTRLAVQRPRPFVYKDLSRAADPANYTAFYSGHTSFAAASMTALWLILLSRGAHPRVLTISATVGVVLVYLTGVYRVLAGRHFFTDTLVALFMGFAVAWCVAILHRPRASTP
jgi:membrane-associated phospholipid phosphatase